LIYVRSRRPLLTLASCAFLGVVLLGFVGWLAWELPSAIAAVALWAGSAAAALAAVWAWFRLRAWPTGKLAFFRDRLVVVQKRHETCSLWEDIEAITLTDPDSWPEMRITDAVRVSCRRGAPMRFKPADFGLDAVGCRDLLMRLRDERELRERLPEFDSERDLEATPLVAGETAEPRF
jgi:hypothetical protein